MKGSFKWREGEEEKETEIHQQKGFLTGTQSTFHIKT